MSFEKILNPELNLSLDHDYGGMNFFSKNFLCAAARGEVDLQAMFEYELAKYTRKAVSVERRGV